MNKNEDVQYEMPEDEDDTKFALALGLEYLEKRVVDVQNDLDKLRADVVEARDMAEKVCDPVTLLNIAADRMCVAGCPSRRCGGRIERNKLRYRYDEGCPAAPIWKELDEASVARRPPYATSAERKKPPRLETRIVYRVTAFGDVVAQDEMSDQIGAVEGVELVEVESVERPKAKAEPKDDTSCPT